MIEGAPLFIRNTRTEELLEPESLRRSLDVMFAKGMPWSQADKIIADFHYRRYLRLTGEENFIPRRFHNLRLRQFWKDHKPTPPLATQMGQPISHY